MCDRKLHHIEMSTSFAISNTKCSWLPIHELSYHIERYFKETKHIRLKDTMNARDIRNTMQISVALHLTCAVVVNSLYKTRNM